MKKWLCTLIVLVMIGILSVFVFAKTGFAWGESTHAYAAKKCLGLDYRYIAGYNARMGSTVPDFFWYLRDKGLIDDDTAYYLHGKTEEPCVSGDTTALYDTASDLIGFWNYRLKYFTEGIRTHVYADIIAHNIVDGYLEGKDMWVDILDDKTGGTEERGALHLAIELSVDALLLHKYGLQLGDILFSYTQANFLERVVEEALGDTPGFDISQEFKKYLALMRVLEKVARLYAPYLIRGEVDEGFISQALSWEFLDSVGELPEESLGNYLEVAQILLKYPGEIRDTITKEGLHWEEDALEDVIDFCREPIICNDQNE